MAEIGGGTFGRVYRALDDRTGTSVAIKVMHESCSGDAVAEDRFLQEMRMTAGLQHQNVVRVIGSGRAAGRLYVVMQFVDGCDLGEWLERKKRVSVAETAAVVEQIAAALDYAHHMGVLHLDVKPQNILVDRDRRVYVADFGISRAAPGRTRTRQFGLAGTPLYMSPEQARGDEFVDYRSDIYSLGVLAYEMLAGVVPFTGPNLMAVMLKHVEEPPPPPRLFNPRIPPGAETAILKALAKRPEDRHQRCFELATALRSAAKPANRWLTVGAPVAAALLLAGAVVAFALATQAPPRLQGRRYPRGQDRPVTSRYQRPHRADVVLDSGSARAVDSAPEPPLDSGAWDRRSAVHTPRTR
jgi:serine/threonine-protein kinase